MVVINNKINRVDDLSGSPILENGTMKLIPIMCHDSYTLFKRINDNSYVVAFLVHTIFDENRCSCSWSQGYYIKDFTDALEMFFNKIGIKLERTENE